MDGKTTLKSISESFNCPLTGNNYVLLGVVEYRGKKNLRNSKYVGHYLAIVKRNINWLVYDDTKAKCTKVTNNYALSIELLIYVKK